MTEEKFQRELQTLEEFFTNYCHDKHKNQTPQEYKLEYKNSYHAFTLELCQECHILISYSHNRLLECPHEIKPRCRRCQNPCYEKKEWKALAKLMRYSGLKLGIIKIKKFLKL